MWTDHHPPSRANAIILLGTGGRQDWGIEKDNRRPPTAGTGHHPFIKVQILSIFTLILSFPSFLSLTPAFSHPPHFFHPWWLTNKRTISRYLCFINCNGTIYLTYFYWFFLFMYGWVIVGVWVHQARWFRDTSISCMSTMRSRMLARSSSARYGEYQ